MANPDVQIVTTGEQFNELKILSEGKLDAKTISSLKIPAEIKKAAVIFANKFAGSLKGKIKMTNVVYNTWITTFLDLWRLDNRKVEEIFAVTRWARQNDFWAVNFLSATKLRNKNKEGIMYYDIFKNHMERARVAAPIQPPRRAGPDSGFEDERPPS